MKPMGGLMRTVFRLVAGALLLCMMLWGALAIYYSDLASVGLRTALSGVFIGGTMLGLLLIRPRRRAIVGFLIVFAGIVAWWLAISSFPRARLATGRGRAAIRHIRWRHCHDPPYS